MFLLPLGHRFLKLTLQILACYSDWAYIAAAADAPEACALIAADVGRMHTLVVAALAPQAQECFPEASDNQSINLDIWVGFTSGCCKYVGTV